MKRTLILAAGLGVALFSVACGEKKPEAVPQTTSKASDAPSWIDNPSVGVDGIAEVGIAQTNPMGDISQQRSEALNDARTKLAGQLKVKVQNMYTQLNQNMTTAAQKDGAKPIKNQVMQRMVENTTRNLTDQELVGAMPTYYTDRTNGTVYVWLKITKETMERAMNQAAQKEIRKEIAQGEKSLEAALDKLDAAIAATK